MGPYEDEENEYTGQVHFARVDERLKQMYQDCDDGEFGRFRTTVFDSMLQALLKATRKLDCNQQRRSFWYRHVL
ncbi:MAG: hypothetical protein U0930_09665 [Pirellulales bacterium]